MLCKKCVLSEYKPDIRFNEKGICYVCLDYEEKRGFDEKSRRWKPISLKF